MVCTVTDDAAERLRLALTGLEVLWRQVDPALVERLAPGLSTEALDDVESRLGVTLSSEARAWFGWHDGTGSTMTDVSRAGGSFEMFVPVFWAETLYGELAQEGRERAGDLGVPPEDAYWSPSWFPILHGGNGSYTGVDCSVPLGKASPVFQTHKEGDPHRVSSSLAEVVEWWIELSERGIRTCGDGVWSQDEDRDLDFARKYRWV